MAIWGTGCVKIPGDQEGIQGAHCYIYQWSQLKHSIYLVGMGRLSLRECSSSPIPQPTPRWWNKHGIYHNAWISSCEICDEWCSDRWHQMCSDALGTDDPISTTQVTPLCPTFITLDIFTFWASGKTCYWRIHSYFHKKAANDNDNRPYPPRIGPVPNETNYRNIV